MVSNNWYDARNILVTHMGDVDSVILIGPALRTLRQALPQANITLLTSPAGSRITRLLPWINEVLISSDSWREALAPAGKNRVALIDALRMRNFDAALVLTPPGQSPHPAAYACYLAGIPVRLGQSKEFGGGVLSQEVPISEDGTSPAAWYLDLLASAGFQTAGCQLELQVPAEIQAAADVLLYEAGIDPEAPFIALTFGIDDTLPQPGSNPFAVARWLFKMEKNMPFVLLGSKRVEQLVDFLHTANPAGSLVSLAGRMSVAEFAAAIRRANLVVASHAVPVRMAEALRRPRMSLFRQENRPQPANVRAIPAYSAL